jgi:DNA-binding transcriptional ArsR family regulator
MMRAQRRTPGEHLTQPIEDISDPRMVRALSHPLRVRVLGILEERTASAVEISRMLRAPLGVVAYHVRTLDRLGLIELQREAPVRGAVQRFFRARERPAVSAESWSKAPPVAKQALIGATLQQINDYARASNAAGGIDRADAHVTRTALKLDPEGWERLAELLNGVLGEIESIEREVAARQGDETAPPLDDAGLVMMLFEARALSTGMPPEQGKGSERSSPSPAAEEPVAE